MWIIKLVWVCPGIQRNTPLVQIKHQKSSNVTFATSSVSIKGLAVDSKMSTVWSDRLRCVMLIAAIVACSKDEQQLKKSGTLTYF